MIQEEFLKCAMSTLVNEGMQYASNTSSILAYYARASGPSMEHRKQYLNTWFNKVKPSGVSVRNWVIQDAFILASNTGSDDVIDWLLQHKLSKLRGQVLPIATLIADGEFDYARKLLLEEGEPLYKDYMNSNFDYTIAHEQGLDAMWEEWADDPWSCMQVEGKLLYFYERLYARNPEFSIFAQKKYNRLQKTLKKYEKEYPLACAKVQAQLYKDYFYHNVDLDSLTTYTQEFSSEEYKENGLSASSYKKNVLGLFQLMIARDQLFKGDSSAIKEYYQSYQERLGEERDLSKMDTFISCLDSALFSLISRGMVDEIKAYHDVLMEASFILKSSDYTAKDYNKHLFRARLLSALALGKKVTPSSILVELNDKERAVVMEDFSFLDISDKVTTTRRSQLFVSPENKGNRMRFVKCMIKYYDTLDKFAFSASNDLDEFRSKHAMKHSRLKELPIFETEWQNLLLDETISTPYKFIIECIKLDNILYADQVDIDKAEPIFLAVSDYYQKNNFNIYERYLSKFLRAASEQDRKGLLQKYAKGTRYEKRYLPESRNPGDGSVDLTKLSKEQLVALFQKLPLGENGLPERESLMEFFANVPQSNLHLNDMGVNRVFNLRKNEIERLKNEGYDVSSRIYYYVSLDAECELSVEQEKQLYEAFNDYHLTLKYKGVRGEVGILGTLKFQW